MIWSSVLGWFSCIWAFPRSIQDPFKSWKSPISHPRGKEMWNVAFLAVIWTLWKERKARCFEGVEKRCEFMCEKIKLCAQVGCRLIPYSKTSQLIKSCELERNCWVKCGAIALYFSFALSLVVLILGGFWFAWFLVVLWVITLSI